MFIERIQRMNKVTFFWKWCACWTLVGVVIAYVWEFIHLSHVVALLPFDRREDAVVTGLAGALDGLAHGIFSGAMLLLGFWLRTRLQKREPVSFYARKKVANER